MKKLSNLYKSFVIFLVAVLMISGGVNVFATENTMDGETASDYVQQIAQHLGIYARYDEVSQASLYRAALLEIAKEHPELYEEIMSAMLESIDEHSEYYNPDDAKLLKETVSGEIVGIGITFQMCPYGVDVMSVIPDTPASKAGIQVGDIIVSADGYEFEGVNSDVASSYIRGEQGTTVRLGIKRENEAVFYVDAVREKIVGTSVASNIYEDGDKKVMYIRVYGFITNTAECFKAELDKAAEQGIQNLIIDLRDNGGGLFDQAIMMADLLVPKGSAITTEDHKIKLLNRTYTAVLEDTYKFDTVVLLNEESASASEVLAAALSENESAKLIGTKSYGKGTIQTVVEMVGGDVMKYTVGYYLTPMGNNINGVGLTPDVEIENTYTPFEIEKYNKFKYEKVYSLGDTDEEIKTAKELLSVWGTFEGEINDKFDVDLENAVYKFQAATGLYPYGVFDLTTQRELYERLKISKVMNDEQLSEALAHFGMKKK